MCARRESQKIVFVIPFIMILATFLVEFTKLGFLSQCYHNTT